jgi:hypothetical protein
LKTSGANKSDLKQSLFNALIEDANRNIFEK